MRILCPMCGYGREVDEAKIPPRAQMATCPKCAHKFRFRVVDDLEPAAEEEDEAPGPRPSADVTGRFPSSQDLFVTPPDPMAAQRASAARAWERLQTPGAKQPGAEPSGDQPPAGADVPGAPTGAQPSDVSSTPADSQSPAAQPAASESGAPENAAESARQEARRRSTGSPVPFEDLPLYGFFPGIWGTIRKVLSSPGEFFRTMPPHGGMAKPLIFHLLLAEAMVVCQYMWSLLGIGATAQYLGNPEVMDMGLGMAQAAPVLLFLVYPLLLVLRLMIMTAVIHLLLKLIRSGGSGAEATFRVLCYSAAPLILGLLPVVGPMIGGVWSIGLTVIGLKQAHKTRASAALFAVLVPILMMLAAVIGLMQGMMKAG